jgi:hypothetical protein
VIGAIFSLVGVIVGGLLTGGVQAFQQRRTERAESRAAARLLSAELSEQHVFLDTLIKQASTSTNQDLPPISAWSEYRAIMARQLDDDPWTAVAGAYVELSLFHAERALALDPQAMDDLVQDARVQLQRLWRPS